MDIEERIAAMAPQEPDVLVLYEAVRELQLNFDLPFDVEVSLKNNIQLRTVLRRSFRHKQAKMITRYNVAAEKDYYRNRVQEGANRYSIIYHNFVAAAYGFCGLLPSLKYRNQTIAGE